MIILVINDNHAYIDGRYALCLRGLMKMSLQYGREVAAASKNLFTYLNEGCIRRLIRLSGTEAEIDSE